jgi:hypothetical protein
MGFGRSMSKLTDRLVFDYVYHADIVFGTWGRF